jgi:predicted metal-dependent enzyme (double-stranded beta helix superfamily)
VFDLDILLDQLIAAGRESEPVPAVAECLRRTMAAAAEVQHALSSTPPGLHVIYGSPTLTVLNVVWSAGMRLLPHDHRMAAVIGIYGGQEDNTLFRRDPDDPRRVRPSGGRELHDGDVFALGRDAIHAVTNPLDRPTGAIHVYTGDFVHEPRSQWGPGPEVEQPFDLDYVQSLFVTDQERP